MTEFREAQSFKQHIWVQIAVFFILFWSWGLFITTVVLRIGGTPELPAVLSSLIPVFIGTAIAVWFYIMKLIVVVNAAGVTAEFKYVFFKRHIGFNEIESAFARKYSPMKEFGGWGVRFSKKNGTVVNVSGNEGVQLILKDGKKLLLGSLRAGELSTAINEGLGRPEPKEDHGDA